MIENGWTLKGFNRLKFNEMMFWNYNNETTGKHLFRLQQKRCFCAGRKEPAAANQVLLRKGLTEFQWR